MKFPKRIIPMSELLASYFEALNSNIKQLYRPRHWSFRASAAVAPEVNSNLASLDVANSRFWLTVLVVGLVKLKHLIKNYRLWFRRAHSTRQGRPRCVRTCPVFFVSEFLFLWFPVSQGRKFAHKQFGSGVVCHKSIKISCWFFRRSI